MILSMVLLDVAPMVYLKEAVIIQPKFLQSLYLLYANETRLSPTGIKSKNKTKASQHVAQVR